MKAAHAECTAPHHSWLPCFGIGTPNTAAYFCAGAVAALLVDG